MTQPLSARNLPHRVIPSSQALPPLSRGSINATNTLEAGKAPLSPSVALSMKTNPSATNPLDTLTQSALSGPDPSVFPYFDQSKEASLHHSMDNAPAQAVHRPMEQSKSVGVSVPYASLNMTSQHPSSSHPTQATSQQADQAQSSTFLGESRTWDASNETFSKSTSNTLDATEPKLYAGMVSRAENSRRRRSSLVMDQPHQRKDNSNDDS